MIYKLSGPASEVFEDFAVISVGGIGYKVHMSARALSGLQAGSETDIFCHLHVREDALDLYGFRGENELEFFEMLLDVSGVGPRSALAVLDVADLSELGAAIQEGRPDLMTRAAGIGRKTAERIVLDLKGKVKVGGAEEMVKRMESDNDILETLVGLGYRRDQAKAALEKLDKGTTGVEARLKEALKALGSKK
jgi:Holliday junction DNA helicase RuvA